MVVPVCILRGVASFSVKPDYAVVFPDRVKYNDDDDVDHDDDDDDESDSEYDGYGYGYGDGGDDSSLDCYGLDDDDDVDDVVDNVIGLPGRKQVPFRTYEHMIEEVEDTYNIEKGTIKIDTMRRRMYNRNMIATSRGPISEMAGIETILVGTLLEMEFNREASSVGDGLELVNSLIKDTLHQDELITSGRSSTLAILKR
jgi:hypothetical protein